MTENIITKEQITSLLLEACPSFKVVYDELDDKDLPYVIAGEFAHHLLTICKSDDTKEIARVARLIESLHVNGDSYVKEFATIGILEDIQNVWRSDSKEANHFETYLLPTSKKYWRSLNGFWDRKVPHIGSGTEES